jgi:glycosyltransferase involved in cell wall biosynthesis
VRSALQETGVTIEVIIVDDCSADKTVSIARALHREDNRVRVVARGTNGGVSMARNDGLAIARGNWVTPLDADDSFEHGRLAAMLAEAERHGADMLADNVNQCDGNLYWHGLMFSGDYAVGGEISLDDFLDSSAPGSVSLGYMKPMIRSAFLADHGLKYPNDIKCSEDWYLYFACLLNGARLVLLPDAYYNYAVHPQSHSRRRARMVENASHNLLVHERARQLALEYGNKAVARIIERRLPHYRRFLLLQRTKKLLLDIPPVADFVDWRKMRRDLV